MTRRWRQLRAWWRTTAWPFWRDVQWIAIGIGALAALVLGILGVERYLDDTGESHSAADTVYRALALFGFEGGALGPALPWQLEVARILAPLVAVYAAVSAVATLLREQLQLARLRTMSKHVVVCGLGARGLLVAKGFHSRGDRVVAIEEDEDAAGIGECREEGIAVLLGDATDRAMLRKARAGMATYVIAVGRDDGINAEVAADLSQLTPKDRAGALTALVHLTDPNLCDLLRQRAVAAPGEGSYRLEFFSVYEFAARALVAQYLALGEDRAHDEPPHVVVVGVGQLGEAVVVHATRAWNAIRPEGAPALAITIVDRAARAKRESLEVHYPGLRDAWDLVDKQTEIEDPDFSRAGFLVHSSRHVAPTVVFVCIDNDSLGLTAAQTLLPNVREHGSLIVVRMRQHAGLATLLGEGIGGDRIDGLRAFPLLDRTCTPEVLLDGARELLAQLIHADFVRNQRERGETRETKPSVVDWDELHDQYKESNRRQSDHIGVKLEAVGCAIEPLADRNGKLEEFSQEEIERLAEMEHDRWMDDLLRQGWRLGKAPSDPEKKTNPYLVPWDELEEEVKGYDRTTVANLPRFLAEAGFRVYRLQEGLRDRGPAGAPERSVRNHARVSALTEDGFGT
jgi:TrkA family protein/RyR domain-containing protein